MFFFFQPIKMNEKIKRRKQIIVHHLVSNSNSNENKKINEITYKIDKIIESIPNSFEEFKKLLKNFFKNKNLINYPWEILIFYLIKKFTSKSKKLKNLNKKIIFLISITNKLNLIKFLFNSLKKEKKIKKSKLIGILLISISDLIFQLKNEYSSSTVEKNFFLILNFFIFFFCLKNFEIENFKNEEINFTSEINLSK